MKAARSVFFNIHLQINVNTNTECGNKVKDSLVTINLMMQFQDEATWMQFKIRVKQTSGE